MATPADIASEPERLPRAGGGPPLVGVLPRGDGNCAARGPGAPPDRRRPALIVEFEIRPAVASAGSRPCQRLSGWRRPQAARSCGWSSAISSRLEQPEGLGGASAPSRRTTGSPPSSAVRSTRSRRSRAARRRRARCRPPARISGSRPRAARRRRAGAVGRLEDAAAAPASGRRHAHAEPLRGPRAGQREEAARGWQDQRYRARQQRADRVAGPRPERGETARASPAVEKNITADGLAVVAALQRVEALHRLRIAGSQRGRRRCRPGRARPRREARRRRAFGSGPSRRPRARARRGRADLAPSKPARRGAGDVGAWPSPTSSAIEPRHGTRTRRERRGMASRPLARRAPRAARNRVISGTSPPTRPRARTGRFASTRSQGPSAGSRRSSVTRRRGRAVAFARATSSASGETSNATTARPGARRRARARSRRSRCRRRGPARAAARGELDQQLGLGPRDQHPPVDRELIRRKPGARGCRRPARAARGGARRADSRAATAPRPRSVDAAIGSPVHPERVGEQQLRVERGRLDAGRPRRNRPRRRAPSPRRPRPAPRRHVSCASPPRLSASSRARFSSASSASVKSSRSPARTASRLCRSA